MHRRSLVVSFMATLLSSSVALAAPVETEETGRSWVVSPTPKEKDASANRLTFTGGMIIAAAYVPALVAGAALPVHDWADGSHWSQQEGAVLSPLVLPIIGPFLYASERNPAPVWGARSAADQGIARPFAVASGLVQVIGLVTMVVGLSSSGSGRTATVRALQPAPRVALSPSWSSGGAGLSLQGMF